MSADIYVTGPGCCVEHSTNVTHNLGPMFRAVGLDWHDFRREDATAAEMLPVVVLAWCRLTSEPEDYEHLNPANGWGDIRGAQDALRQLMRDLARHPDGKVSVSL